MSQFVVVNDVDTTLATVITSTDTSITLSSSANLPTLSAGQLIPIILRSAGSSGNFEIVYGSAISGATLTVQRGMEGTTPSSFNVGDYAVCGPTAGTNAMVTAVLTPTASATLLPAYGAFVIPGSLTAAITLQLPSNPPIGTAYKVFGGNEAVTLDTGVTSGSPGIELDTGSEVYSITLAAAAYGQSINIGFDGTNWRGEVTGESSGVTESELTNGSIAPTFGATTVSSLTDTGDATVGGTLAVTGVASAAAGTTGTNLINYTQINTGNGSLVGYDQGGTGAVQTNVRAKLQESTSVLDFGAVAGTTDSSTAIQNAINAVSTAGGGTLLFPEGMSFSHASTLTLLPGVILYGYDATLTYTGTGTQITTNTSGVTMRAGIIGLTLSAPSAGFVLELYSIVSCIFQDVLIEANNTSNTGIAIYVNTSGTLPSTSQNYNSVFNYFGNVQLIGEFGTGLVLEGNGTVSPPAVCTLNTFVNFMAYTCNAYGIAFSQWCDSNYFAGITRISMVADNSVGVVWNTADPTSLDNGVYSDNFDHLAVDTFGSYSGQYGFVMNATKANRINYYFNDPQAEGGAYQFNDTASYYVAHQVAGTNDIVVRELQIYHGGTDNPNFDVGSPGITTQDVTLSVGKARTGSGVAQLALVGDTTYPSGGLIVKRQSGGANAESIIEHYGTGEFFINAMNGGGIGLANGGSVGLTVEPSGISFNGAPVTGTPSGYGTPTGAAVVADFPGSTATLQQTSGMLANIITVLINYGLIQN